MIRIHVGYVGHALLFDEIAKSGQHFHQARDDPGEQARPGLGFDLGEGAPAWVAAQIACGSPPGTCRPECAAWLFVLPVPPAACLQAP